MLFLKKGAEESKYFSNSKGLTNWQVGKKYSTMIHKPVLNKHYCLFFGSNHSELRMERLPNFEMLVFRLF